MIQELSTCNLQSNIGLCKSENVATPASGVRISKSLTDPSPNPKSKILVCQQSGPMDLIAQQSNAYLEI